eukprot:7206966-Alexandrium_andersonii.AAC.1
MAFAEKYQLHSVKEELGKTERDHSRTANAATVDQYLSSEQSDLVREYYKEDYCFFEQHGIVFTESDP